MALPSGRFFCDVKLKCFSTTISTTLRLKIACFSHAQSAFVDNEKAPRPFEKQGFQGFSRWYGRRDSNPQHSEPESEHLKR